MVELAGDADIECSLGVSRDVPALGAASGGDDGSVEALVWERGVEFCKGREASELLVTSELRAVDPVSGGLSWPLIWIVGVGAADCRVGRDAATAVEFRLEAACENTNVSFLWT